MGNHDSRNFDFFVQDKNEQRQAQQEFEQEFMGDETVPLDDYRKAIEALKNLVAVTKHLNPCPATLEAAKVIINESKKHLK